MFGPFLCWFCDQYYKLRGRKRSHCCYGCAAANEYESETDGYF